MSAKPCLPHSLPGSCFPGVKLRDTIKGVKVYKMGRQRFSASPFYYVDSKAGGRIYTLFSTVLP